MAGSSMEEGVDMATERTESLRSDAAQNRERILTVAFQALTKTPDVSMNAIAKEACVGAGTLYRHFPTRDDLVLAVYRNELQQVVDASYRLLEELAPVDALREWLLRIAQYGMTKHGLLEAIRAEAKPSGLALESHGAISGAVDRLLRACEADGSIRAGMDAEDFLLAMHGLFRMNPESDWRTQAGRLIDFLLDGLRAGRPKN